MKSKPLFVWVVSPDGRVLSAREMLDHCINIQGFYRKVDGMGGDQVLKTYADEIAALRESAIEKGVQVIGPQWFARLF